MSTVSGFTDTHSHIYATDFTGDLQQVIDRALAAHVERIYLPAIDAGHHEAMLAVCGKYPGICFPMMGLHPTSVGVSFEEEMATVEQYLEEKPGLFAAIGEIGIDLYWDKTFSTQQETVFSRQLDLAVHYGLPVVIHTRNSMDIALEILERRPASGLKGVFHCFSGNIRQAEKVMNLGFLLGIGGVVTYKNSGLQQVVEHVPIGHLVLETDAPWLTPSPHRGTRNEPSYIPLIASAVAKLKGMETEEVMLATTKNAIQLFGETRNLKPETPMIGQTSILVIYTGGTIGMVQDPKTMSLRPLTFDILYKYLPVLENFNCRIDFHTFEPLLDSSNMNPGFWVHLADVIGEKYEEYDGFVVLHGSDTMAYTASALSFMLENLNKPVVFTGSQLPIGMVRTDGRENFINSIEIAAAKEIDTPVVPEVSILFENKLYRGNRTSKFNAEHFGAFVSGNYPLLAEVGVHIRYNQAAILKPNFKKLKVNRELDPNIAILKLFPGITPSSVEAILQTSSLKAVILETFGAGNAPTAGWFLGLLQDATNRGIIVFNVTQCKGGSVEMGKYETSAELSRIGVIGGFDITTESAVTKLMYLLGCGYSAESVKQLLQTSLRGEMTV